MELIRKNIHIDRTKCKAGTQIAMEDDINITDSRPDVYQLVQEQGEIILDEIRAVSDHVYVKGKLRFTVLYLSDDDVRRPASMEGSLPFEEQVYMEGVAPTDGISVKKELEDLSVGMINSRKLSVQALVSLNLYVEELYDEDAAVELAGSEPVEVCTKTVDLASLAIQKKDIFRIREEIELPGGYPNILEIFWMDCRLMDVQLGLMDGRLSVQGQIQLFFLYEGEGEGRPVAWYETNLPFSGLLDCQGLKERMAEDIVCGIGHKEVEVKADSDGEERLVSLEVVLDLDMKIYEEEQAEILFDVYGVTKEIEAVSEMGKLKQLLMKNTGKSRLTSRFKVADGLPQIQQICHSECSIQLAEVRIVEEGLRITGAAAVRSLYASMDEEIPYDSIAGTIPFSYVLEIPGITPECTYRLETSPSELTVTPVDAGEVDVKLTVTFCGIVFSPYEQPMIRDIRISEPDPEKLASLPGIVAYIARDGDSLWDIGKKYYVPVSQIREINELSTDEIRPGEKLLIVKGAI